MYKTSIVPLLQPLINLWRTWWRKQTPNRQDRFAFMAPLAAVVLFMAAITTAFWYLRYEEIVREQEVVRRDVEYAQQRLRLRLLDKQEQMMLLGCKWESKQKAISPLLYAQCIEERNIMNLENPKRKFQFINFYTTQKIKFDLP